jgi:probable F420-dependent oxidoreductase
MRAYLAELDAATPPVPRSERLLAALGPRMLELARERAAGAHPYLVTVEQTVATREALGADRVLAPELSVVLEADRERGLAKAREHIAGYLTLPNYTANFRRAGFADADLADGGSRRLVEAIVAIGDEGSIAARVGEHLAAGADHVCIQIVHPGGDEYLARDEWRRLAPALLEL